MKTIVITGSTRGIGRGLAEALLDLGCQVVVSGRARQSVDRAVAELAQGRDLGRILGQPCNVNRLDQVEALWEAACARFGQVDIWINNAGIAHPQHKLWELDPEQARAVVETNVLGSIHGARVALRGMLAQGSGSIYLFEGLGSDGRIGDGLSVYGTTKYGIRYLSRALIRETRGLPVLVGMISPGMVLTDLLIGDYRDRPGDMERFKRVLNILADRVETVAPWIARRVLDNDRHGARIAWLTTPKVIARFVSAPFTKRDLFADQPLP